MTLWLLFLAAWSQAASFESGPSPALRAQLPGLAAAAHWSRQNADALPWGSALDPLVKSESPALEPLAQALASAGPILEDIRKAAPAARRALLARLEAARIAAGPGAASRSEELLRSLELDRPVPDEVKALKARVADFERTRDALDSSLALYGEIPELRTIRRKVGESLSAARGRLVTLPLREQAAKLGLALDDPAAPAPLDKDSLRAFLEDRHKELLASNPEMFLRKMKKGADSDFAFFRGFPDVFYLSLRSRPEAAGLLKTPKLFLAGDLHYENIELMDDGKRLTPQVNDFDDAGPAPVAADLARMLTGVGLIGIEDEAELYAQALDAYQQSLKQSFKKWADGLAAEKAVEKAKSEDRDWLNKGGKTIKDKSLAAKLFKLAGLDPAKWTALDRMGAGLSSIGVLRYLFAGAQHKHALELKELRASSLEFLTGAPLGPADRDRLAQAYLKLRQVPVDARTMPHDGKDWLLRRREGIQWSLNLDHQKSAARVIGGLVAQVHLASGGTPAQLEAAAREFSVRLALSSLQYMARMRALLADGVWSGSGTSP
ncbi:MAG: DUF2252 family protein [Elusimicrobia bacterium]|nr:DUF2252 family protein [Elusimicrobiota bacterium]